MPTFLKILKAIAPYIKYVIFVAAIIVLLFLWRSTANSKDKIMELYQRQMIGQLTAKEIELQQANLALGLSQSKLMEQSDLAKAFERDGLKTTAEFEKFKKAHKIELESYQRTIARLEQQMENGVTIVNGTEVRLPTDPKPDDKFDKPIDPAITKLAYNWKSGDGRAELNDPDVFTPNNEVFKLRQSFRVTGETYRERAGFLKTNKLSLEEVVEDGKNSDGTPKYKVVNTAQIVDSKFNYTERAPDSWIPKKGVAGVWGIVSANFGLYNGVSPRFLLGTGVQFLNIKGFGVASQIFIDTTVIKDTGIGLTLLYRPTIKNTQLNLGINISAHTPFNGNIGRAWTPSIGIQFHLW